MIKSVTLNWQMTDCDNLRNMEEAPIYIICHNNDILYIGKSDLSEVNNEVNSNIYSFKISKSGLNIWLGYIDRSNISRVTSQLVRDTERLLIYRMQPLYNSHYKKHRNCPLIGIK